MKFNFNHIHQRLISGILTATLMVSPLCAPLELTAQTTKGRKSTTKTVNRSTGKNNSSSKSGAGKSTGSKRTGNSNGKGSNNSTKSNKSGKGSKGNTSKKQVSSKKPESSQDLKRRQQSVQAEVNATKAEIRKNDASIKKNLSELSKIEGDIAVSQKETNALGSEVKKLSDQIGALEQKIATHTGEVNTLREEYLKAVKRMRVARKGSSKLGYIFGAKSLSQAARRMRYLKEFSAWKDKQTSEIQKKVELLRQENEKLKTAEADKKVLLARELKSQQKLNEQKRQQDVIVADLRANGEALNAHLANKQAEANQLRNQVAALIAEEQRRAEEARRKAEESRRAEEARKAEQARKAEEARLAKAEEARKEEEKRNAEIAANQPKNEPKKETPKKETPKKENVKKDTPKTTGKKESSKNKGNDKGAYAAARQRRPRNDADGKSAPKVSTPKSTEPKTSQSKPSTAPVGADFASMRGALPRPVSGAWRVVSPFGKHSLPDLPHVTYDNPGIDVEVSNGSVAKSVHVGTVSGVYMIPGFSTVVIVNHGDYYTVYGNIASANVKVGDKVSSGQTIGKIASDPDNPTHSQFHFEVWKGREKLNPSSWIK